MNDLAIPRPDDVSARPLMTRLAHSVRNVAPRVAGLLPGVVCRSAARDHDGRSQLYLTIDDGPDAAGTPLLLDALSRHQASATFFVLASRAIRDPGLLRAIADAGHRVANHGWSHLDAWREAGATQDLERGERWLQDVLGLEMPDLRPPYGHVAPSAYRWARRGGRRIILWDVMPGDFEPSSEPAELADTLVRRVRAGSIVVLHDGDPARRAAATLDAALPRLREAGWRLRTL